MTVSDLKGMGFVGREKGKCMGCGVKVPGEDNFCGHECYMGFLAREFPRASVLVGTKWEPRTEKPAPSRTESVVCTEKEEGINVRGRPKKWASEAERVKAYRERQRGS